MALILEGAVFSILENLTPSCPTHPHRIGYSGLPRTAGVLLAGAQTHGPRPVHLLAVPPQSILGAQHDRCANPGLHDAFDLSNNKLPNGTRLCGNKSGYEHFSNAMPNDGHKALARMERELGILHCVITQNVDGM